MKIWFKVFKRNNNGNITLIATVRADTPRNAVLKATVDRNYYNVFALPVKENAP